MLWVKVPGFENENPISKQVEPWFVKTRSLSYSRDVCIAPVFTVHIDAYSTVSPPHVKLNPALLLGENERKRKAGILVGV